MLRPGEQIAFDGKVTVTKDGLIVEFGGIPFAQALAQHLPDKNIKAGTKLGICRVTLSDFDAPEEPLFVEETPADEGKK
jgi:hypothetical protein